MRCLALLSLLIVVGCNGPRQINPGALVPVYLVSQGTIARLVGRAGDPSILGAYDREHKALYVATGLGAAQTIEVWTAEYDHLIDDCGSHDQAAALITGPTFRPACHDSPAARRAAAAAAIEAARAR